MTIILIKAIEKKLTASDKGMFKLSETGGGGKLNLEPEYLSLYVRLPISALLRREVTKIQNTRTSM